MKPVGDSSAATDLLTQAITYARPLLSRELPLPDRLRNLWSAVAAAADLGAVDVVEQDFLALADEVGLAADLGHHSRDDLRHVVRWALREQNPFWTKP